MRGFIGASAILTTEYGHFSTSDADGVTPSRDITVRHDLPTGWPRTTRATNEASPASEAMKVGSGYLHIVPRL